MQNYVGKQIDRYRIIERLGMGGMAVVYKAYDTRLERDVALKLIRVDEIPPSQHERLMKRFEREAKAMARFSHPNIVPVHDFGEVDGTPYLVMEFVPGGTLKERINKPVPYQQAIQWLIPIADALRYAHERNVFHRDVKPSNILFDSEERPLLTDFGIAKVLETDEATLTGTGLGVGTPEYMAPEQWQGQTSEATDQYALGVVLYELITGRKPYSADTPAAVAILQATEPMIQPSKLVGGIPDQLEKVLYKALARDPQDRYENIEKFQTAIQLIISDNALKQSEVIPKTSPLPVQNNFPDVSPIFDDDTFDKVDLNPDGNKNDKGKAQIPIKEDDKGITAGVRKKKNRRLKTVASIVSALIIVIIFSMIYFTPTSWWCQLTGNVIGGCDSTNSEQSLQTNNHEKADPFTIGISNPFITSEYRTQMIDELIETNAEYMEKGLTNELVIESFNTDVAGQIEQIYNLINQGVDAILVNPSDTVALKSILEEAVQAGILVLSINQEIEAEGVINVGHDQYEWAKISADWFAEKLQDGDVVLIEGFIGHPANDLRMSAVYDAFEPYPGINVLASESGSWDEATSQYVMSNFLAAYPNLNGYWTQDGMAIGALEAVIAANPNPVPLGVGEASVKFLKLWKEMLDADPNFETIAVANAPGVNSSALRIAVALLQGRELDESKLAGQFGHQIVIPIPIIVTPENFDEIYNEYVTEGGFPDSYLLSGIMTEEEIEQYFK